MASLKSLGGMSTIPSSLLLRDRTMISRLQQLFEDWAVA